MHCTLTLSKRFYERSIGFENVLVEKPRGLHPFESLPIEALRCTRIVLDDPHGEFHIAIIVRVRQPHERATRRNLDAELFSQLTSESVRFSLARVHFATGKFPATRHVLASGSLRDEHVSVVVV